VTRALSPLGSGHAAGFCARASAAAELAEAEGFTPLAVTADEEIRGPFLLARGIFACPAAYESGNRAHEQLQRVLDAISGRDDPTQEALTPDHKLLRAFDLAAVAVREDGIRSCTATWRLFGRARMKL
jgi:hypothetical protein